MNIKVIDLIKEALVGGRNGEMAYIYNNPFIFELFNQWKSSSENFHLHKNDENIAFKEFLKECLKEDKEDEHNLEASKVITYKTLTKEYHIYLDEEYREWEKMEKEIQERKIKQRNLMESIAKKHNKALADISQISLQSDFMGKKIVFEFTVESILEYKQQLEDK